MFFSKSAAFVHVESLMEPGHYLILVLINKALTIFAKQLKICSDTLRYFMIETISIHEFALNTSFKLL